MRTAKQRQQHALELLSNSRDVWVATASRQGRPHLVPFSLGWDGQAVLVATEADSVTVRNTRASGLARLAVGTTRDVVLIDATVKEVAITEIDTAVADAYAERNGWDPRRSSTVMVWLVMKPQRILAWQDEAELEGREIMKNGHWLADNV